MQKQAPSLGRILVMVLFALSCFGLLLFLWLAFGGSTPLKPKGYRVTVPFPQAGQLAQEADVRISGVTVGRVKSIVANPETGVSDVEVEIEPEYAPVPRDSRVMLRQKTLLGETYVELTPGRPNTPTLPDGGKLPVGNIAPTVQLDNILQYFDAKTRAAFEAWQEQQAIAGAGRGRDINDFFAALSPFIEQTGALATTLNRNEDDLSKLVKNTGVVFSALSERGDQLRGLIRNTNTVFKTTAERDEQLAQTFVALPTFQRESRLTLDRLVEFADDTNPLYEQLQPVTQELGPTMRALEALAPELSSFFENLDPAITASEKGFPAINSFFEDAKPFFSGLDPSLAQLNPLFQFLGAYPEAITSAAANFVIASQAQSEIGGVQRKYVRTMQPFQPMGLAPYPARVKSNRFNPYPFPRSFDKVAGANMPVFGTQPCGGGIVAPLDPSAEAVIGKQLFDRINRFAYDGNQKPESVKQPAAENVPAPGCTQQGRFGVDGRTTQFPQVGPDATPAPPTFSATP